MAAGETGNQDIRRHGIGQVARNISVSVPEWFIKHHRATMFTSAAALMNGHYTTLRGYLNTPKI